MSDVTSRIDGLLLKTNQRRADLSRGSGVGESTIRAWINGSKPSADALFKIAKFLNVSVEYLLTGEGESKEPDQQQQLSFQEQKLLEVFRILNDNDKNAVLTLANGLSSQYSSTTIKNTSIG